MSGFNLPQRRSFRLEQLAKPLFWGFIGLGMLGVFGLVVLTARAGLWVFVGRQFGQLLALQGTQVTWFITRSAGWMSYLLLWLSTAWGLAVPSKLLDGLLPRNFTFDFHEFLSLLSLAFVGVHIGALYFDQYQPFSIAQILLPFLSDYRPIWVGLGGLALYLSLAATVTFYLRKRIGMRAFRLIHLGSFIAFGGAALHGLLAGTDSPLPAARLLYFGTFLSIVFLTAFWLLVGQRRNRPPYGPAVGSLSSGSAEIQQKPELS